MTVLDRKPQNNTEVETIKNPWQLIYMILKHPAMLISAAVVAVILILALSLKINFDKNKTHIEINTNKIHKILKQGPEEQKVGGK
jgi:hypothetical protein